VWRWCRWGLLIQEEPTGLVWRGPMRMGSIRQFLYQVGVGEARCARRRPAAGTVDAQATLAQPFQWPGS